ncbi:RICIN domain-containing protein [Actinosynnema sp. NPDC023794]
MKPLVAVLTAVGLHVSALPPTAAAQDAAVTYVTIVNRATGMSVDGMGRTADGAAAAQYPPSGSANQQWLIEESGSHVRIRNRATGLYLDSAGRAANGAVCAQWQATSSQGQQWTRESVDGHVKFRNAATGLYLDSAGRTDSGADLKMYASSGSANQQWSVVGPPDLSPRAVVVDGDDVRADNVNGLTFKGFGLLSGNSSSELLMDYKSEQPAKYLELLQVLFGGKNPVLTNVKVEMGNDRNNSTGPDPSTMRWETEDVNVTRHQGFQLAADAKKINPSLKVSILRWNAPAWANTNDKIYTWYKKSILAAYRAYGYMVDYVNPGVNEHTADLNWSKRYAELVRTDSTGFADTTERDLYRRIGVTISDEAGLGTFGDEMVADASLRDAVAVAAYHYNTDDTAAGDFKRLAESFDEEVWNSEAQATFGNSSFRPNNNMADPTVAGTGVGGKNSALEMGNTVIKGFANSRRTNFIYQPAVGSFYEGGQYGYKELVSARDPWSGWLHYDLAIDVLRHFSWFAKTGWENPDNTAGIWRAVPQASHTGATGTNPVNGRNGTPSYLTLAAPDKKNFSTVFVNDSEWPRVYHLRAVDMAYTGRQVLKLWETRAADAGQRFNANHLRHVGNVNSGPDGTYTITVKPYSALTATTLPNIPRPAFGTPLPVEGERTVLDTDRTGSGHDTGDDVLYADDFDYRDKTVPVVGSGGEVVGSQGFVESRGGSKSAIPLYTSDRNGAFEAHLPDGSGNYVLRQQVDEVAQGLGGAWNPGDPVTRIGDNRWLDYEAGVDVSFENNSTQSGKNYAAIGVRQQHGDKAAPYKLKFWFDGGWSVLVEDRVVAGGNVATGAGGVTIPGFDTAHTAWHNIALRAVGDKVTAYLDGAALHTLADATPKLSGRVELGSGYYYTRFDNLRVQTVGTNPSNYAELLDNLEMHDLGQTPAVKLRYGGSWSHVNGTNMYDIQRTLSTSRGAGSTLTYTFTGTGLDIVGQNNGSAVLEVTVDGTVVHASAATVASPQFHQTYALRGLANQEHTVQVKVLSGTLVVDAVGVVAGRAG